MYKVKVNECQLFDEYFTIGDVLTFYAERADFETKFSDMLFFMRKDNKNKTVLGGIITKEMSDYFIEKKIKLDDLAKNYVDKDYPCIFMDEIDIYTKTRVKRDTPVLDHNGKPIMVVLSGYIKDGLTEHYICKVLSGTSSYHLSVNADMTVSCNCMLRKGGQIGNLKKQSLQEIYDSQCVSKIRTDLYSGILPTVVCINRCEMLRRVPKSFALYYQKNYTVPKSIMFETISSCNLKCERCFNKYIDKSMTTLYDAELFAKECKKNSIKTVCLFKYGEPFLDKLLGKKIDLIRKYNEDINIIVSSNGLLLDRGNNFESALKLDNLIISLDGIDQESLDKFQKNNNFKRVYSSICELVKLRNSTEHVFLKNINWKYVLFKHNDSDQQLEKLFSLALQAGVDSLSFNLGFNAIEGHSGAIWKSEVFLKYMELYSFEEINNFNTITFYFNS